MCIAHCLLFSPFVGCFDLPSALFVHVPLSPAAPMTPAEGAMQLTTRQRNSTSYEKGSMTHAPTVEFEPLNISGQYGSNATQHPVHTLYAEQSDGSFEHSGWRPRCAHCLGGGWRPRCGSPRSMSTRKKSLAQLVATAPRGKRRGRSGAEGEMPRREASRAFRKRGEAGRAALRPLCKASTLIFMVTLHRNC